MNKWFQIYQNEVEGDAVAGGGGQTTTDAPASTETASTASAEPVKSYWPDDWRDNLAGGDPKLRARLDRFSDPSMILASMQAAENKIRSGEYKKGAPDKNAAPEDIAAWKAENGIPEKWEDYDTQLDDVEFEERDQPTIDSIRQWALSNNMSKDQAKGLLGLYSQIRQHSVEAIQDRDEEFYAQSQDTLRAEWGGDYRRNINLINGLYAQAPEGLSDLMANGRLADGTRIGDNPTVLKWLAGIARELNPVATVVPGSAATAAKSIDEELASIDAERKKDPQAFFSNEKLRSRERELLTAQAKLASR